MTRHYVDKARPDLGYFEVFSGQGGFLWRWREVANGVEYTDNGQVFPTKAEAYRDAADDWEQNGNSANRRLGGQLRAAATRAERPSRPLDQTGGSSG